MDGLINKQEEKFFEENSLTIKPLVFPEEIVDNEKKITISFNDKARGTLYQVTITIKDNENNICDVDVDFLNSFNTDKSKQIRYYFKSIISKIIRKYNENEIILKKKHTNISVINEFRAVKYIKNRQRKRDLKNKEDFTKKVDEILSQSNEIREYLLLVFFIFNKLHRRDKKGQFLKFEEKEKLEKLNEQLNEQLNEANINIKNIALSFIIDKLCPITKLPTLIILKDMFLKKDDFSTPIFRDENIHSEIHFSSINNGEQMALLDLNNLKFINDTFGHKRGDEMINIFRTIIINKFKNLKHFRIGGDEFISIGNKEDIKELLKFTSSIKFSTSTKIKLKDFIIKDLKNKEDFLKMSDKERIEFIDQKKKELDEKIPEIFAPGGVSKIEINKSFDDTKSERDKNMYVLKNVLHFLFGKYERDSKKLSTGKDKKSLYQIEKFIEENINNIDKLKVLKKFLQTEEDLNNFNPLLKF